MANYPLREIACIMGQGVERDLLITGFQQDNRLVVPGNLFFALKGEKVDGHAFLGDAAQKGAVAAIVSKDYTGDDLGMVLLKVDNVLLALHAIAHGMQQLRKTRVIAVTGSVGKTTTKEFIATLLEGKFRVGKTPGNANSQVGLPLSLLNAAGDEEVFVAEMGMSQPGELTRLVAIAPPEISVVTNISLAHATFFEEGVQGIAQAKSEIFSSTTTRAGVVSSQAISFDAVRQSGDCRKIVYGLNEGDYFFDSCTIVENGVMGPAFKLPFEASHLRENFLAATAVARLMGMEWTAIGSQIEKLATISGRFQKIIKEGITFINDSYNANATSMKAALNNLPQPMAGKKRIAVLGAMRELGPYAVACHEEVAQVALDKVDCLLCLGEECQPMVEIFMKNNRQVELFTDLTALKQKMYAIAEPGDVILLKGSNSNQLWKVLEPFTTS